MIDLRTISDGEQGDFVRSAVLPFLDAGDPDAAEHWWPHLEPDRTWLAREGGRPVANCCIFTRSISVPGPPGGPHPSVDLCAVSGVGVHPTHRRRGLLTRMMAAMVGDARQRGEPLAALLASEAGIYGRFGFGVAVRSARTAIDTHRAALRAPADAPGLRLLSAEEAVGELPALHEAVRTTRPGEVSRSAAAWADLVRDPPRRRGDLSAWQVVLVDGGWMTYRTGEEGERGVARVQDLAATAPEVEAALFAFVASIDLVQRVTLASRPVDDHLAWRLADHRALEAEAVTDWLWVRVLDTPAALTARRWGRPGRLVLDVAPPAAGPDPAAGRWLLDVADDGTATCEAAPASAAPDLALGLSELGACYLGGTRVATLAAAGLVRPASPAALAHADAAFASVDAPFDLTGF